MVLYASHQKQFCQRFTTTSKSRALWFLPLAILLFMGIRSSFGHRPANISDAMYSSNRILSEVTKNSLYSVSYAIYANKQYSSKVIKLKKELQEKHYELLVSPSLHSSSDTFFTFLVSTTYKLGFYSPDVFSPLTHGIPFPSTIEHEALKPLALMSAFGKEVNDFDNFMNLQLTKEEKKAVAPKRENTTIGIFHDARNEKKIKDNWWRELMVELKKIQLNITIIEILDPNKKTALNENMETLSEKSLRVLALKISQLDAFICGDTGPMHLASASLTPTIALFKTTSPTLYGTLGEKDLSLEMQGKSVKEVALIKRVHHQ